MAASLSFDAALPRLVTAYDQGVLVPFLGAGMSRFTCPDWKELIASLEAQCGLAPDAAATAPADLVRRGNRAVRLLKRREEGDFPAALRRALYGDPPPRPVELPEQTAALARIWWPLVMTTNYDDLFAVAHREAYPKPRDALTVAGRSPHDSQQVLSALTATAAGPLLWALQGYLPRQPRGPHLALEDELVVGHEEYRRVTHTALHFRRAFAEVFRRRSLLFLGSGLSEAYLLDLFGEILEFSGANPLPHYAMVRRGSVDVSFLRSRFNVIALEFDDFPDLPRWLDRLRVEIDAARVRPTRWTFRASDPRGGVDPHATDPHLELVRGPLPAPGAGECVAVSAGVGRAGTLWFSHAIATGVIRPRWPAEFAVGSRGSRATRLGNPYVFGHTDATTGKALPVVAVLAREGAERADLNSDRRDLRIVGEAATELFGWAAAQGFARLRMALLASGKTAHFRPTFSLAETVRAFGQWKRATGHPLPLTVHLLDPGALFDVSTGRLDVGELLTCDDVRFWVEVVAGGRVLERELIFAPVERTVGELADHFDVRSRGWMVEVSPRPQLNSAPVSVLDAAPADLLDTGVLPGATLRFVAV